MHPSPLQSIYKTFRLFQPYLWHKKTRLNIIAALFFMLCDVLSSIYIPFCFTNILGALEHPTTYDALGMLLIIYTLTLFVFKTSSYILDLVFYPVINTAIQEIHYNMALHTHNVSMHDYQGIYTPELISYQKRVGTSARFFLQPVVIAVIPSLFKCTITFLLIWQLNIFRTGILLGLALLILMFCYFITQYMTKRRAVWNISDKVCRIIADSIINTKIVRFYKKYELKRIRQAVDEEARIWYDMTFYVSIMQISIGATIAVIMAGSIYLASYAVVDGTLTIQQFVLLGGQLGTLFLPIIAMITEIRLIIESVVDIEKIASLFDIPQEQKTEQVHEFDHTHNDCIVFDNVSFHYEKHTPTLTDVNLTIQQDENVLIFGASGAGKSTLLGLMTGLLQPSSGTVYLLGQDITSISLEAIAKIIHFIPQEPQIFNGTLYENITFGIEDIDEEALLEAIDIASLSDFIKKLPEGLNTSIGEMGSKLSGGEKQRLALARAFLLRPYVLIFDETTNALDKDTEHTIFHNIKKYIKNVIYISHKPYTLDQIDRYIEVKNQQVIERSTR